MDIISIGNSSDADAELWFAKEQPTHDVASREFGPQRLKPSTAIGVSVTSTNSSGKQAALA